MVELSRNAYGKPYIDRKFVSLNYQILVIEIEARVNNRPLTYLSDDFSQSEPLSPSHLIHGGLPSPLISLADEDPADHSHVNRSDLVESYQHLSSLIKKWNEVWTREYLTALREYHYRASSSYNKVQLKPGDLVLVDSDGPKSEWPIGKIVSVHPDRQGILRTVNVLCRGTTILKTLEKLVPLELTEHKCSTEPTSPPVSEDSDSVP
ncbi:uncharacterized protein [Procambarus clarkii]|uniref:uncharacterized protein n=1 Tax=Procambarus clarkii TaxID=6728 RepID=UPI00374317C6